MLNFIFYGDVIKSECYKGKSLWINSDIFIKKIELVNSAFIPVNAKNDSLTANNRESVILCVFMTHNITLFLFYTIRIKNSQIILNSDCRIHHNSLYIPYISVIILFQRDKPVFFYPRPPSLAQK